MNETISKADVEAGQAVYSQRTLWMYDWLVLGLSNRFVWKCPTSRLLAMYNENVTDNHLDVGVGTGFFLDRCRFPGGNPRVGLLDLNENCLSAAAGRIGRYKPECYRANLLEPINIEAAKFDSIAVNYVLHCLPGTLQNKSIVFENLQKMLNPSGVLFGSTILHDGAPRGRLAKLLMTFYNKKRIFTNTRDSLTGLQEALRSSFENVTVDVIGCVARFTARSSAQDACCRSPVASAVERSKPNRIIPSRE